ncbi:MAG: glycosyltransferase [Steroidobacteraceae bacterium]
MMLWQEFSQALFTLQQLIHNAVDSDWIDVALKFFPFVFVFELPAQVIVMLGGVRYFVKNRFRRRDALYHPLVSCVITCYSEGEDVRKTVRSLAGQLYPGRIEMFAIVDGARQNRHTLEVLLREAPAINRDPKRRLEVVPKTQRGGRVSSLNQGLALARGEIVMALDGDTSFDNDMVGNMARHFANPNVVAVSGNLRVRNARKTLVTRLQALEYMLSIHLSRAGLDQLNVVNNISGAFGAFRRSFIAHIGGWDSGTAEDLDLTLRIKKYFARHPQLRIRFEPRAIGHTDSPETLGGFLNQRLRWDGDLSYLYLRKYRHALRPGLLGWPNFIALLWTGLFFQIALPFLVIGYMVWVFFAYPAAYVIGVLAFIYLFYLLLAAAMYLEYLLLFSERKRYDLGFAWVLLVFPAFAFITRSWNGIATLSEMLNRTHLDSSMAPWWVLRKTRF